LIDGGPPAVDPTAPDDDRSLEVIHRIAARAARSRGVDRVLTH
jgi:hypothetical protein